jgi:hypothetical protein
MPSGGPGDHPLTDMLVHGKHPYPADMEDTLRRILAIQPKFPDGRRAYIEQVEWETRFFAWERGEALEEGRAALRRALDELECKQPPS